MSASTTSADPSALRSRIDALAAQMAEKGVDLSAIVPSDNLRYMLGFSPIPDERLCFLLVGERGTVFVVPALNAEQSAGYLPGVELLAWADAEGFERALRAGLDRVAAADARRIAADPLMRADHLLALQARVSSTVEFVSAEQVLGALREVKSRLELDLLAASALTADDAVSAALRACRPGIAELEVAAIASQALRDAGADEVIFTIVASGPNGALPHHHSGSRVLEEGDAVVIDLGGRRQGYCSDITRMAFLGEPTEQFVEVAGTVEQAVQAAMATARPGVTAGEVDSAARSVIEAAGHGDRFVHRTGHGLGLAVHEPPWIMGGSDVSLREGMVFSIEPGIYLPGSFGVRLEEIVFVTESGCERFSKLTRDIYVAAP